MILCIDTALERCSIALCWDGKCLDVLSNDDTYKASEVLHLLIEKLLSKNNLKLSDLNAIAVNGGPGSYTGLRIGATTAKGLCYALNIPLIHISGLRLLTEEILERYNITFNYYIPMIDARRMEVFTCIFDQNMKTVMQPQPTILTTHLFDEYNDSSIIIYGNGAEKAKTVLNKKHITYVTDLLVTAEHFKKLVWQKWIDKEFENSNTYAPSYLKKFYTASN